MKELQDYIMTEMQNRGHSGYSIQKESMIRANVEKETVTASFINNVKRDSNIQVSMEKLLIIQKIIGLEYSDLEPFFKSMCR